MSNNTSDNNILAGALPYLNGDGDEWLEEALCRDLPTEAFFVRAGHTIEDQVIDLCRRCPVRTDCLRHSYRPELGITSGYFGGVSPGQRRQMSLEEAEEFCRNDAPGEEWPSAVIYT